MQERVYRTMAVLCRLVARFPVGTNVGLMYLLWMMVSGRLLGAGGAVIPGLAALGLPEAVVRRAWASLGSGAWGSEGLIAGLGGLGAEEGRWRAHRHGGYRPVAADLTGFFRPRLAGCPTKHYHGAAGKALPAIPVGVVARVGSVGGQRWGLPLALVRADPADPSAAAHAALLVRRAVALLGPGDALVVDREFGVRLLQAERVPAFVVRVRKNFVARRARVPAYAGKGRPAERGDWVRPLARTYAGKEIPATPPDLVTTWTEDGVELRGETWLDLVLPDAAPGGPTFRALAIHDPRYAEPLLLVTPRALSARDAGALYHDRWPVEQLPLAGKQMVGAARQFVSE